MIARKVFSILTATILLSGCSMINDTWHLDMKPSSNQPVHETPPLMRVCSIEDITHRRTFYIDSTATYYQSGFIRIYGKDGKLCRLSLGYI